MTSWHDVDREWARESNHAERAAQGLPLDASEEEVEMASAILSEAMRDELEAALRR